SAPGFATGITGSRNAKPAILNTLGTCLGVLNEVEVDTATYIGIEVKSNKTLISDGTSAILNGKSIRESRRQDIGKDKAYIYITGKGLRFTNSLGNYVYITSRRSLAVSGTTTLYAINNVFSDNSRHLIEGSSIGLFEGNVFTDITTTVASSFSSELFNAKSTNLADCSSALGRKCVANEFDDATSFDYSDTRFFSNFAELTVVDTSLVSDIFDSVTLSAGNTLAS
ncbi:hypothetical protein D0867_16147, partial [Hortaea werneckii]